MLGSDLDWWLDALPVGAEGGEKVSGANKTYTVVSLPLNSATRRVWLAVFTQ